MISENQLFSILYITKNKMLNNKTLFGSPLKRFINNIYNKFEIPKESFIISLYYLFKFYDINKNNNILINNLHDNINYFIISSIIITLKQLYDESFDIKQICEILQMNYNKVLDTELLILKGINWNTHYDNTEFYKFKNRTMELNNMTLCVN
jgi:hypothetical protein